MQSKKCWPNPVPCAVWQALPQHAVPAQQLPPHACGVAPEHPHVPPEHPCPVAQACPQAPQFAASVCVFTHAPEQLVVPEAQQRRFEQLGVAPGQTWPHPSQFAGSVEKFTQPPAHWFGKAGLPQTQVPPEHVECGKLVLQSFPHEPHAVASVWVFRHCGLLPVQLVALPLQVQAPEEQVASVVETRSGLKQACVQVPQKTGSVSRSTHFPGFVPHTVGVAGGQLHVEEVQLPPVGHRAPHAPQLAASAVTSVQLPQQVLPVPQVTPQPPQFEGSRLPSTHLPPHSMLGEKHFSFVGEHPARRRAASGASKASRRFTDRMIARARPSVHLTGGAPRVCQHANP